MSGASIIGILPLLAGLTAILAARPAWALFEDGTEPASDYFVLGLIVFCGALLVLLLRRSSHARRVEQDLRDARRARDTRELILSGEHSLVLYFETEPGSLSGKQVVRITPALRRILGLPDADAGSEDTESILAAFDSTSRQMLRDHLLALRADGAAFEEDLRTLDGAHIFSARGARVEDPEVQGSVDAVWFEAADRSVEAENRLALEVARSRSFELMVAALPIPVWCRDEDLEPDHRNPAASALIANEDLSRNVAARALSTLRTQSESIQIVAAGDRRLFEFFEWPMPDGSGTVGWAMDVTTLEAVQTDLARLVAAHEEVLEELSTAIAIFGPDRRLGYFNTAFIRLWKLETDQLRDEPTVGEFLNLLRDRRRLPEQADFAAFRDSWNAMFTGLIGSRQELLFLPDETTLRMVATEHPNGGLLLTFEDVTDRLALERSYNVLSAVQRQTIDNLNDALAVFGSDGRLQLLNPRFGAIWKLPADIADHRPHISRILEMMRPTLLEQGDWEAYRAEFTGHLNSRAGDTGRVKLLDGVVLDYALMPLSDGATLVQYWDVTASILIERALRERAEALEQADRLKSEFLANVSYELRTPLNAIIGFSELLKMQAAGPMNDKQVDYADSINASSMRLVTLVNDILDLASIEAGYMELDRVEVDIRKMFDEMVVLAQERLRRRYIELDTVISPDGLSVHADPVRLKQAIFNLLSNALQFTPEGGSITLAARREAEMTVLEVSDTGVGIPDHLHDRVFETFVRGETPNRSTGAGLGLALVERIVRLHGGVVKLESSPGEGTRVSCWIPRRPGPGKDGGAATPIPEEAHDGEREQTGA